MRPESFYVCNTHIERDVDIENSPRIHARNCFNNNLRLFKKFSMAMMMMKENNIFGDEKSENFPTSFFLSVLPCYKIS